MLSNEAITKMLVQHWLHIQENGKPSQHLEWVIEQIALPRFEVISLKRTEFGICVDFRTYTEGYDNLRAYVLDNEVPAELSTLIS